MRRLPATRRFALTGLIAAEPEHIAGRLREAGQVEAVERRQPSPGDDLHLPAGR